MRAALLLALFLASAVIGRAERPNVLLIAVDDWNDWVGRLGDGSVKTPHMDRLAKMGTLFTNAHCAAPVCNPSRAGVFSGLRPSTTGVYENGSPLQLALPKGHLTLFRYFQKHGYETYGAGKIFHDVIGFNIPDNWTHYFLWNEVYRKHAWECGYSRAPDPEPPRRPFAKITSITKRNFDFGPTVASEDAMPDFQSTTYGVEFLKEDHQRPFFLAVGQFKPHAPWFVPQKYFDLYPIDEIALPPVREGDVDDLPDIAKKRALDSASKHHKVIEFGEWKKALQGYKACISFSDAQIGRLLDALESGPHGNNTVVVLFSDHGYHLGEKGHWHKRTLWERSTHIPLIIVAPGVTEPGTRCAAAVDLMAVYPTLLELCGLPPNPAIRGEGRSLVPMLNDPSADWDTVALCTHRKGNHAVRSRHFRYIRYQDGGEELYDHREDPHEWNNLAGDPSFDEIIADHRKHLPEKEAPEAPSHYTKEALLRITGETYDWKRADEVKGDPRYQSANKLKGPAFKAAAEAARKKTQAEK